MLFQSIVLPLSAFLIAAVATLLIMPFAKRFGTRCHLIDHPDEKRKLHQNLIPLVGGLTVFVTTLATVVLVYSYFGNALFTGDWTVRIREPHQLWGLLLAAGVLLGVGLIDDRFSLRGRQKLMGQIAAATILILCNYSFESIQFWGIKIEFGHFALLIMYGWILGGINSVNLLDGADGFATSLGALLSGALCIMSIHMGAWDDAILAAAMCGALVGFLRYNFPPASAYLGDSGSMVIGLMIAAIAIRSTSKQPLAYAFFAPLALLAIPMFDTLAAIVRRQMTGKSIYNTDRGHIHHALMRRGLSPRLALLWFTLLCLTTVTGATLSLVRQQSEYAIVSIVAVVIFLIAGRVFGFAEFKLLSNKAVDLGRSFFEIGKSGEEGTQHRHLAVQLQGDRNWELVWQSVREFAEKHNIQEVTLDLDLPWIHENFHATYRNSVQRKEANDWSAEVPVQLAERIVGRLVLRANLQHCSVYEVIPQLIDSIDSLQPFLQQAIERRVFEEQVASAEVAPSENREADRLKPQAHVLDAG